ncbi:hypothetical protein V8E36_001793 [Tilletia maclaganii]
MTGSDSDSKAAVAVTGPAGLPTLAPLTKHESNAPIWLYIFSFCDPIPWRSPRGVITHPIILYIIGFIAAICSAATIPSLDLNYGFWVNALSAVDITPDERTYISNRTAYVSACLGLANALFTTIYFTVFCIASEKMATSLREKYVSATLAQDSSFFDLHGPGEVASRVSKDVNAVRVAFGEKTAYATYGISNLIVALCFAFARSPAVAAIIFAVIPVTVGVFAILGMLSEKIGAPASSLEARVATYVEQMLSSPRVVQAFSMQTALIARLESGLLTPLRIFGRRRAAIRGAEVSTLFFTVFATYALFFSWGAFLITRNVTNVGRAMTAFWSGVNSLFGLSNLAPHIPGIISGYLSLKTLRITIERQPKIDVRDPSGTKLEPGSFEPSFELQDVTFAYAARPNHASLREVSFKIAAGQMTALVGPSGSGKSTIASLLIREADPETSNILSEEDTALIAASKAKTEQEKDVMKKGQKKSDEKPIQPERDTDEKAGPDSDVEAAERIQGHGIVCFAGHDVRTLKLKWLRSQVAVVQQHPQLFTGTVFANVAAGLISTPYEWIDEGKPESELTADEKVRYDAARIKVQAALEKAQAAEFVGRLPQGIDTVISGGRTGVLSGGQRQRIAIARALVSEPLMLCLDEATSALDSSTEERIRVMLEEEQRARGMTTVTIAHRLSTVEKADRILVIDHGQVVDDGTHDELMQPGRRDNTYRRMVMRQRAVAQGDEADADVEAFIGGGTETESADALTRVASGPYIRGQARDDLVGPASPSTGIMAAFHTDPRSAMQRINSRSAVTHHHHHVSTAPASTPAAVRRRYRAAAAMNGGGYFAAVPVTPTSADVPKDLRTLKRLGRTLWIRARPQLSFLLVGSAASLLVGAAFPLISWLTGLGIHALGLPDLSELTREAHKWSLYLLLISVLVFIFCFMQGWYLELFSDQTLRLIQRDTLGALLSQEIGYFDAEDQASGGLTAALTTHPSNVGAASGVTFGQLLMSIVNIIGSVVLAFILNWRAAAVGLSPLVLVALAAWANVVYLERYETMASKPVERASAFMSEQIDGIRTVAALGRQEAVLHIFRNKNKRLENRLRHLVIGAFSYSMTAAAMLFIAALVFWWSGVLLNRGETTNTEIFAGLEAVIVGSFSLMRFASLLPDYARALSSLKVLTDWLERVPKIAKFVLVGGASSTPGSGPDGSEGTGPQQLETVPKLQEKDEDGDSSETDSRKDGTLFDNIQQDIVFRDVEMRYPLRPEIAALRSLDLTIRAGETTAFVGTSGSGKSSILSLLSRFYDPVAGSIECGGVDIRAMPLEEWRGRAALVSQDPVLYEGSVRWNLTLGALNPETVTDAEIRFACEQACILDFILSLPAGFDEDLGMKGMNLSGGQKQRLCIARALLRRPEFLLLDEATSALDAESEATVQLALERASKGRTTVVIAHRLSTIRKADTIHVVEDGRIVESGSHSELLARKGRYLELIEAQL